MSALRPEALDEQDVEVPVFHGLLGGCLFVPSTTPRAAIIVALPGGIGRLGRLERFGAAALARAGYATLLLDLLTEDEADVGGADPRTDVPLLADRLSNASRWLGEHGVSTGLRLGYLGVGEAATAALFVSALQPDRAFAVVSRGHCASLAASSLHLTRVPTLFIVTGGDARSHQAHREACAHSAQRQVEVVASSEGDPEGANCDRINELSAGWFHRWLGPRWTGGVHAD
jgi:putative phosphoribosyl transferase